MDKRSLFQASLFNATMTFDATAKSWTYPSEQNALIKSPGPLTFDLVQGLAEIYGSTRRNEIISWILSLLTLSPDKEIVVLLVAVEFAESVRRRPMVRFVGTHHISPVPLLSLAENVCSL